jgi:hypothetical protein
MLDRIKTQKMPDARETANQISRHSRGLHLDTAIREGLESGRNVGFIRQGAASRVGAAG